MATYASRKTPKVVSSFRFERYRYIHTHTHTEHHQNLSSPTQKALRAKRNPDNAYKICPTLGSKGVRVVQTVHRISVSSPADLGDLPNLIYRASYIPPRREIRRCITLKTVYTADFVRVRTGRYTQKRYIEWLPPPPIWEKSVTLIQSTIWTTLTQIHVACSPIM